jgi:hypothetical protein
MSHLDAPLTVVRAGIVHVVTELLPNLDALRAGLKGDSQAVQDARALAEAAQAAVTEEELQAALTDVVTTWRRS